MPLSQQIQDQIRKDAETFCEMQCANYPDLKNPAKTQLCHQSYCLGATVQAEKAQIVVTLLQEMIDIYKLTLLTLRKYAIPAANEKFDVTENSPIIKRATAALSQYKYE